MVADINVLVAAIVGFLVSSIVFGMNVLITLFCTQNLSGGIRKTKNKLLLLVVISQLAISTVHIASLYCQLAQGFLRSPLPEVYFLDQSTSAHIAAGTVSLINNLIADCILIWRVLAIWSPESWICLPSVVTAIGHAVSGFVRISYLVDSSQHTRILNRWTLATLTLSLATQCTSTLLIATGLYWRARGPQARRSLPFRSIICIVVESGAILSIATIFTLVFFEGGTNASSILSNILGQLACFVSLSIILRVQLAEGRMIPCDGYPPGSSGMLTSVQFIGSSYTSSAFVCSDINYPAIDPPVIEDKWKARCSSSFCEI